MIPRNQPASSPLPFAPGLLLHGASGGAVVFGAIAWAGVILPRPATDTFRAVRTAPEEDLWEPGSSGAEAAPADLLRPPSRRPPRGLFINIWA